ncbi:hypothetical protein EYF80_059215 [Liparis tanakae]|uniref:Uncharacterized protein n=1 Tax=Liparis tanakae TaxID=230148 RepID=A0A4Z2EPB6_9TELE|nr:hypothetical protein EYF80_059215 [Liparis tanakae]
MGGASWAGSAPTPCMRRMCCCRFPRRLKRAAQRSQPKGRSPVCTTACRASCERHFLSLPQTRQTKLCGARAPSACSARRWRVRCPRRRKPRPQKSQRCGRRSLCTGWWLASRDRNLKTLPHTGHGNALAGAGPRRRPAARGSAPGAPPLRWTRRWCCFRQAARRKPRRHTAQR